MSIPWLPSWLGLVWTGAFVSVVVVHLWHVVVMTGRPRAWHGVHVLMSTGMIVMFVPTDRMLVPAGVGAIVFGIAAVGVASFVAGARVRAERGGGLWLVSAVDLAAMAYMFTMMSMASLRLVWLTMVLVAWFAVQAAGWAGGRGSTVLAAGGLGGTRGVLIKVGVPVDAPVEAAIGRAASLASVTRLPHPSGVGIGGVHSWTIRVTLSVMALGMGYMLLVTQFGMGAMPGMAPMSGM
ncbi:MAG: DUF5134 domain-containing protein [Sciscionella sp.]